MSQETENFPKILENNIDFFYRNIEILKSLRPELNLTFEEQGMVLGYSNNSDLKSESINEYHEKEHKVRALNSSIILNCFSLFESAFEWNLLKNVNANELTGIQERIVLKYISNVIKISSIENYLQEYKFLTGSKLTEAFCESEKVHLNNLKKFYVLRHLLVHGSALRIISIPSDNGTWYRLDNKDKEYHNFIDMIKENFDFDISFMNFHVNIVLLINQIADFLVTSTMILKDKLVDHNSSKFTRIK